LSGFSLRAARQHPVDIGKRLIADEWEPPQRCGAGLQFAIIELRRLTRPKRFVGQGASGKVRATGSGAKRSDENALLTLLRHRPIAAGFRDRFNCIAISRC
jgi:hypothetical protein